MIDKDMTMRYDIKDILDNIIYSTMKNRTVSEFVNELAAFFMKYMSIYTMGIFEFNKNTITTLGMCSSYDDTFKRPDKIVISEDIVRQMYKECFMDGKGYFHVRICRGDSDYAYCKVYNMVHPEDMTTIYCPLVHEDIHHCIYMSISSLGKNCYTQEDVELCEFLQRPLGIALSSVLYREYTSLAQSKIITDTLQDNASLTPPIETLDEHITSYIRKVVAYTNGRISGEKGAAALLGIPASTLWSKMRKLHMYTPGKKHG